MMPRYFFDIADGDKSGHDDEGLNFPDIKAARAGALQALGEIARDELPDGDRRISVCPSGTRRGKFCLRRPWRCELALLHRNRSNKALSAGFAFSLHRAYICRITDRGFALGVGG